MLFYKKETLYLSGTYWNFHVYKILNGASPFRSILLRKKNFINKISDYSDLYSLKKKKKKSSNNKQTLFKRF